MKRTRNLDPDDLGDAAVSHLAREAFALVNGVRQVPPAATCAMDKNGNPDIGAAE